MRSHRGKPKNPLLFSTAEEGQYNRSSVATISFGKGREMVSSIKSKGEGRI